MFLPSFGAREHKKMQFVRFGGLDLRAKAPAGTLSQCENMSADAYPALTPRKPRRLVTAADGITALAAPEYTELPLTAFTGVRNRHFYYQGTRVSDAELLPGEKSIADFNGKLCILPDKLYYDYQPDPDTGETAAGLQSMEKALTLSGVTFYASHSTLTVRLVRSASNIFFFLIDKKRWNIFRIHLKLWFRSSAYPTIPTKIL